ncbi:fused response regulator/phosphatase [Cellvibrio sp. OA-2007]|uniref:fused response regulator/phosphatase n=1 Tax=Cellvibrio sp. OA-2007 TaxID=529823 RepID=UPI000A3DA887|nr:fused response regulator/phosphatase [Cellvibrio sp. OA-2007]
MNDFSFGPAYSILVVDDDEYLNELMCQFLRSKGFVTHSICSYLKSFELLKTNSTFDLIVLDYQLGDGTGLEFLADLDFNNKINKPPVIMISSNQDSVLLENCFAKGVTDYLIKPVNLSLLALKASALINTVAMQKIIALQTAELERFKSEAEREESIAKATYEYLLQQNSQVVDGVTAWLQPSASFSGDIALTKISPSGDFYFLLADATGHGLSAAITLMPMVSIFSSMVDKNFNLNSIVTEINKKLIHDTPGDRFVAAVIVHWRREQNEIDVWNGGMPPVYWMHKGKLLHQFDSQHMALGILEEGMFDASVVSCPAQSLGLIVAYSDGLIEETNEDGVSFSIDRVANIALTNPAEILASLVVALEQYTGRKKYRDDISICILDMARILAGHTSGNSVS